jgi:hypothetical protein
MPLPKLFWFSLCLLGGVFGPGFALADEPGQAAAPPPPAADRLAAPEVVKPVIPSKAELADSAFQKLDATRKGYVTMEDTKGLDGFDQAFREADADHTGKLDFGQFKKAWAQYSGYQDKR